jgi:hypothetical protein
MLGAMRKLRSWLIVFGLLAVAGAVGVLRWWRRWEDGGITTTEWMWLAFWGGAFSVVLLIFVIKAVRGDDPDA